ncbi:hypothetical protein EJ06DRAFT_528103 [Trichodelitschia bisporula]|uniref:Uncharacterized protein n=1 Tax=Trichodelitschia bisporula TaxID=703511 RepID=A0A6G1I4U9_9PEZI|nr:hypothetical protein EJ06DRAFT_528103 [Trichodelitschia bisporula]
MARLARRCARHEVRDTQAGEDETRQARYGPVPHLPSTHSLTSAPAHHHHCISLSPRPRSDSTAQGSCQSARPVRHTPRPMLSGL